VIAPPPTRQEDFEIRAPIPRRPGDIGSIMSVRRPLLDPILAEAAVEAGAKMRMATKVTGLLRGGGRAAGVKIAHNGSEATLESRLVVGADGRNSTIAELAGSRKYNLTPSERFAYWSFFEGVDPGPGPPEIVFHRWEGHFVLACPADSGLYQVIAIPEARELPRFREDLEGAFLQYINACAPVARTLSGARRVGKIFGIVRWEGFFRDASGPGWVLVGDAGHFKDPSPGQGIQDAFRQADALAPAIVRGLRSGSDAELDRELREWGRWRDKDAAEHYWLATDLGKAGSAPAVLPEIARRLRDRGKLDPFLDLFNHRSRPSKVLTPPRLLGAAARLLRRPGTDRRALLKELGGLVAEQAHRQRLARKPVYAQAGVAHEAGPTEVEDAVAA
jgi:flavin-dependent dehydrogenase